MRMLSVRYTVRRMAAVAVSLPIATVVGAVELAPQQPGTLNSGTIKKHSRAAPDRPGGQIATGEPEVRRDFKALIMDYEDNSTRYSETLAKLKPVAEKQAYIRALAA